MSALACPWASAPQPPPHAEGRPAPGGVRVFHRGLRGHVPSRVRNEEHTPFVMNAVSVKAEQPEDTLTLALQRQRESSGAQSLGPVEAAAKLGSVGAARAVAPRNAIMLEEQGVRPGKEVCPPRPLRPRPGPAAPSLVVGRGPAPVTALRRRRLVQKSLPHPGARSQSPQSWRRVSPQSMCVSRPRRGQDPRSRHPGHPAHHGSGAARRGLRPHLFRLTD